MQRCPDGAELLGAVHVRPEVPVAVRVEGDVGRAAFVSRGEDAADVGAVREAGGAARDLVPAAATVPRHLNVPVVGANPEHGRVQGGLRDGDDLAVRGDAVVAGELGVCAAHPHDLQRVAVLPPGEVFGAGKAVAPVPRDEEAVAAQIDHVGVVARDQAGRRPVPAVRILALGGAQPQAHHVARHVVEACPRPVLRVDVDGPSVRIGLLVHPVAVAGLAPLVVHDSLPGTGPRRAHPGVVVLHAAVDPVGVPVIHRDPVELPDRQVVDAPESHTHVVGLVQSGVAGQVEVLGVARVDPHGVMVGVDAHVVGGALGDPHEGAAAVLASVRRGGQGVDAVLVRGVDEDVRVVHGPDILVADLLPALATVLAAKAARLAGVLDERVQDLRVRLRDREPNPPLVPPRQAVGELTPVLAAIGRLCRCRCRGRLR